MENICFLFGSGADTDYDAHLRSGTSFIETLLCNREKATVTQLMGNEQKRTLFTLIHPNSKRVFLQTIVAHPEKAREIFKDGFMDEFVDEVLGYDGGEKIYKETQIDRYCHECYNIITSTPHESGSIKQKKEDAARRFFLENAVFFDTMDEKFNSLRNVEHLNRHAWQVIYAYWSVFVQMLKQAYHFDETPFEWTREQVFSLLQQEQKNDAPMGNSYYCQLKKSGLPYRVATTNYTDHVEKILGEQNSAYLHGKLHWFENLEDLGIYDCRVEQDREHLRGDRIIPFILIPSGVKPIVGEKQLIEYGKFIRYLHECHLLVVVGYRFNSEDNHINSLINGWLRQKQNHMIYLNWCGCERRSSVNFGELSWCAQKTRCSITSMTDLESLSDLIEHYSIVDIHMGRGDAQEIFKAVIERLKKLSVSC